MKQEITQHIHDPETLESLYRKDKNAFAQAFPEASEGTDTELVRFWLIRLGNENSAEKYIGLKKDLLMLAIFAVVIAVLVKLDSFISTISIGEFLLRNFAMIILAGLTAWFMLKNQINGAKNILLLMVPVIALAIFLNMLPGMESDTTRLALIHAPVFMWFIFGLSWVSFKYTSASEVSSFIRYNGELLSMFGLLCIAGAILSGMTISLFSIIGMNIGDYYMQNIGIIGLAIFPVLAAWLIELYPDITSRIAPVIARIFTPLVLISAIVYMVAIAASDIHISADRDFLITFNLLLLGVMAIVVFSLSELDRSGFRKFSVILLFFLGVVTLIIDFYALSAIISRLSEGFTPNRTSVLVSNILILVHLLLILPGLFNAGFRGKPLTRVEKVVYSYLPVYFIYSFFVIFIFPIIF